MITGAKGKLGRELLNVFPNSIGPSKAELDIRNDAEVTQYVRKSMPQVIVHAAALTGIRQCEDDKSLAWSTNVEGTRHLIDACRALNSDCYLVYVSTACVFFGDRGDYTENDVPNPKNFYALTKLLGESAILSSGLKHSLIVRTNFVPREKWPYAGAFTDRYGTYLFADDLAIALKKVIDMNVEGLVHVCGKRKLSMYELACLTTDEVRPITLADYQGPPLTADMTLRSSRIESFDLREKIVQLAK